MRFQATACLFIALGICGTASADWTSLVSHDWSDRYSHFQFQFRPRFSNEVGKLVVTNGKEVAAGRYEILSKNQIRFVCLNRWNAVSDLTWELQSGQSMGQSVLFEFDRSLDNSYTLTVIKQSMCNRKGVDSESPDAPLYHSKPIFKAGAILKLSRLNEDDIDVSFPGIASRDVWRNMCRDFKTRTTIQMDTDLAGEWHAQFSSVGGFHLLRLVASEESKFKGDAWFIRKRSTNDPPYQAFRGKFSLIEMERLESHDQLKLRVVATRIYDGEDRDDDEVRWTLSGDRGAIDFVIPLSDSTIRKSLLASIETLHQVHPDGSINVMRGGLAQLYKPLQLHKLGTLKQNLSLSLEKRVDGYGPHDQYGLMELVNTPPPGFRLLHPANKEWTNSSWDYGTVVKSTPSNPPPARVAKMAAVTPMATVTPTATVTRTAKVPYQRPAAARATQPPAERNVAPPPKPRLVSEAEVQQILIKHEAKLVKQGYYDQQGTFVMRTVDAAMFYGRIQSVLEDLDRSTLLEIVAYDFATNHRAELRSPQDAIALAIYACQQVKFQDASALDTLAAAYASAGEFDLAVSYAEWGQQYYKFLPEGVEPDGLIKNLTAYRNKVVPRSSHRDYQ